ncbi:hypothetical protein CCACVL1_24682 [Corchorus capsularis]|uniref:Uncharacterized protein n=1 Tax=Corchorus capsularis TaxID=210143 RepID=A0A1R3GNG7_COCAP|nr:hypothetical protein CCACVL1_24682 [Corchorus capsularis]
MKIPAKTKAPVSGIEIASYSDDPCQRQKASPQTPTSRLASPVKRSKYKVAQPYESTDG